MQRSAAHPAYFSAMRRSAAQSGAEDATSNPVPEPAHTVYIYIHMYISIMYSARECCEIFSASAPAGAAPELDLPRLAGGGLLMQGSFWGVEFLRKARYPTGIVRKAPQNLSMLYRVDCSCDRMIV